MLPGFIIEQIKQREEEAKRQLPQIELPLPMPESARPAEREEEPTRGVVIIDLRSG